MRASHRMILRHNKRMKCSRKEKGVQLHKHLRMSVSAITAIRNKYSLQSEMNGEIKGNSSTKPVEHAIRKKLADNLNPTHLEILNESYMHNVPPGSETHFKVVIVSDKFDSLPLIKRHRMVNDVLSHELQNGVHALSIMAKTPTQWEDSTKEVSSSPACRGGFGK